MYDFGRRESRLCARVNEEGDEGAFERKWNVVYGSAIKSERHFCMAADFIAPNALRLHNSS